MLTLFTSYTKQRLVETEMTLCKGTCLPNITPLIISAGLCITRGEAHCQQMKRKLSYFDTYKDGVLYVQVV